VCASDGWVCVCVVGGWGQNEYHRIKSCLPPAPDIAERTVSQFGMQSLTAQFDRRTPYCLFTHSVPAYSLSQPPSPRQHCSSSLLAFTVPHHCSSSLLVITARHHCCSYCSSSLSSSSLLTGFFVCFCDSIGLLLTLSFRATDFNTGSL
jgi:hypothetical protein